MLKRIRKRRAVAAYLRELPRLFRLDYGSPPPYPPRQVEATVGRAGLSTEHVDYALLAFCERATLTRFLFDRGDARDLDAMQDELDAIDATLRRGGGVWRGGTAGGGVEGNPRERGQGEGFGGD